MTPLKEHLPMYLDSIKKFPISSQQLNENKRENSVLNEEEEQNNKENI